MIMAMTPIARSEILPLGDYEQVRPHFRARVIAIKKPRRLTLGERMSAVFENRDSVLMQIQEMLRTERITAEEGILHEIETYNDLLPGPGQLSVTVFVEIADKAERDRTLEELKGLERSIALEVDGERLAAKGDPREVLEGRTTAVHYMKIDLSAAAAAAIAAGTAAAALVVDHPAYQARAELSPETLRSLAGDLA
jgi:hypothetical protein